MKDFEKLLDLLWAKPFLKLQPLDAIAEKEEGQTISPRRVLMNSLAFEKEPVFFHVESQAMMAIQEILQAGMKGRNRFFANGMALRL